MGWVPPGVALELLEEDELNVDSKDDAHALAVKLVRRAFGVRIVKRLAKIGGKKRLCKLERKVFMTKWTRAEVWHRRCKGSWTSNKKVGKQYFDEKNTKADTFTRKLCALASPLRL